MTRRLAWRRTVIGGEPQPDDYAASLPGNDLVYARIYRAVQGPKPWYWTIAEAKQIASGYEETHAAAAGAAEAAYEEWERRR